MKRVAVVILNWNGVEFLKEFLPYLITHTDNKIADIIVADNASVDDSIVFVENNYPQIQLLKFDKNHGFAGGYNRALENLNHEYFLLLNSDIEVTEHWLEPMVEFLDSHPDYACCSPLLLDYNNRQKFEYAGAAGGYIDKFGYTFCRGRIFNTVEDSTNRPEKAQKVFWTTGACMLIRATDFHETGGFDDHFFAHMEEVDLCWRLKNRGKKGAVIPSTEVYHVGGGTLPKSNPFKTFLNFRNNLLLLYKNLPQNKLRQVIRKRILMDGLSALLFLISFKFRDIAAIYRAHSNFRLDKQLYVDFRSKEEQKHRYPSHSDIYRRSVVVDYFILRRKRFCELRDDYADRISSNNLK